MLSVDLKFAFFQLAGFFLNYAVVKIQHKQHAHRSWNFLTHRIPYGSFLPEKKYSNAGSPLVFLGNICNT